MKSGLKVETQNRTVGLFGSVTLYFLINVFSLLTEIHFVVVVTQNEQSTFSN